MTPATSPQNIVGVDNLGRPLAVELGKHRPTTSVDINTSQSPELLVGQDRTCELEPEALAQAMRFIYTANLDAIRGASAFIIKLPTPIDAHERPSLKPPLNASETVTKAPKEGDIVIYESTLFPRATEDDRVPVIECVSGPTFYRDFFCDYSPERIDTGDELRYLNAIAKGTAVKGASLLVLELPFKENCPDQLNTRVVDVVSELRDDGVSVDVLVPWFNAKNSMPENGIFLTEYPMTGAYEGVILIVSHDTIGKLGISCMRELGLDTHKLYDHKSVFNSDEYDMRL